MPFRLNRIPISIVVVLSVVSLVFINCSKDDECPVCPDRSVAWVTYDAFDDNTLDDSLWSYSVAYGGQVLETSNQLQVWGNTNLWTGSGLIVAKQPRLGWKFKLVDTYFEEGPGCQGWHVRAIDPTGNVSIEILNRLTVGCAANMGDSVGEYEVKHDHDSLAVYKDGSLLRRFYANGITYFTIRFYANNVYGSGHHCHIFIDDVQGLVWKEWTP